MAREREAEMLEEISGILKQMEESRDIEVFLTQLLTPTEQAMIRGRWELVKLHHRGVPQREIAAQLGMSLCKVTRGARGRQKKDSIFRRVLEKTVQKE